MLKQLPIPLAILILLLAPARGVLAAEVGINLEDITYYATEYPFLDLFKSSQVLRSQRQGKPYGQGGPVDLREDGYPKRLDNDQSMDALVATGNPHYRGGRYICLYKGKGRLRFKLDARAVKEQPGRIEIEVTPTTAGMQVVILQTDPADPIHDIRLVPAEFEKTYEKQPFDPVFLKTWTGVDVVRFMLWMRTNSATVREWADRAKVTDQTQGGEKGVALEHMIDLVNLLDADPWFCIPHTASDDYVREFAKFCKARLNPNRKVYIEYSNEVWNGMFQQARHAVARGRELNLANNDRQAGLRYHAQRSQEIFAIFEQVFGGRDRLVRVLAVQWVNLWGSEQVVTWKDAARNADALAVAPYFGLTANPSNAQAVKQMSVDQIIDASRTLLRKDRETLQQQAALAKRHNLKLIAYEGGQGMVGVGGSENDPRITELFIAANRHPAMYDLFREHHRIWTEGGGGLYVFFQSSRTPRKSGSWGLQEYQGQGEQSAHKLRAVKDIIRANTPAKPAPAPARPQ